MLVAANVTSSADFGGGPVKGTKYYTGSTLARLDPDGEAIWSRWLESTTAGIGVAAIAVDADGNLIMTGTFRGTFDLGTGPIEAGEKGSVYVAKLDPAGEAIWARAFSPTVGVNQRGSRLAVAPSGDLVVTGAFTGTLDLGTGPLTSAGEDIFLLKLDASGVTKWSERFGGPGNTLDQVASVAVGPAGEIVMAGSYQGALDFGAGPLPSSGAGTFLAALGPDGVALWSQTIPGVSCGYNACPVSVAVSPSGGVVVAGTRAVDPANPDEVLGLFHRVLSANGDLEAAHELPGVFVHGIAREKEGSWLLTGAVGGHVVSRIDPGGDVLWGSGALAPENMNDLGRGATGIALDPAGDVLLVGAFSGTLDFGTGTLTSAGKHDIFVARLAAH